MFVSQPHTLFDPVPELDRNRPDSAQLLRIEEAFLQEKTLLSSLPLTGDSDVDGMAQHLLQRANFALCRLSDIRTEKWEKLRMDIAVGDFTNGNYGDAGTCRRTPVCRV